MTDIRQKKKSGLSLSEKTGSLSCLVRSMGLEPIRLLTHAPQTCLSAYSSTTANNNNYNTLPSSFCQSLFGKIYIHFCRSFSGGYFRRTTETSLPLQVLTARKKKRAPKEKRVFLRQQILICPFLSGSDPRVLQIRHIESETVAQRRNLFLRRTFRPQSRCKTG